jgi:hypothetical protein
MNYYVYAYLRSKTSKTETEGTPYYIGKGTKRRAYAKHYCPVPNDRTKIQFIETNLTEQEAHHLEIKLIAEYGRKDNGTGILHNLTNGGEGTSGVKRIPWNKGRTGVYTEKQLSAMSESAKKRPQQSAETQLKKSVTMAGRTSKKKGRTGEYFHTEERKQKIALSKIGKKRGPMSQDQKDKISISLTGVPKKKVKK